MRHRPLRDACDAYVRACERFLAAPNVADATAFAEAGNALVPFLDGIMPSVQAARAIRDAINAAWEAGYEERVEDEGK